MMERKFFQRSRFKKKYADGKEVEIFFTTFTTSQVLPK